MKNKIYRLFRGIFFIACAILIVLNQIGIFTYKLGFWAIIGSAIFLWGIIDGLIKARITEAVFSISFLLMIFAQPLHITKLVPWTLLLAAALISIGLSIIFHNRFHTIIYTRNKVKRMENKSKFFSNNMNNIFTDTAINEKKSKVKINQTLSDTSRYINSKELKAINIGAKMSSINLYLDNAEAAGNHVDLNLDLLMVNLTLFVPLSWTIDNTIDPTFSNLEISGTSNGGGPVLHIAGHVNMSNIKIKYI